MSQLPCLECEGVAENNRSLLIWVFAFLLFPFGLILLLLKPKYVCPKCGFKFHNHTDKMEVAKSVYKLNHNNENHIKNSSNTSPEKKTFINDAKRRQNLVKVCIYLFNSFPYVFFVFVSLKEGLTPTDVIRRAFIGIEAITYIPIITIPIGSLALLMTLAFYYVIYRISYTNKQRFATVSSCILHVILLFAFAGGIFEGIGSGYTGIR